MMLAASGKTPERRKVHLSLAKLLASNYAVALLNHQQLVHANVFERFHQSQRPLDFNQVCLLGPAKPKVQAKVILGHVTGTAHYLIDLGMPASNHAHANANGAPIGLGT